MWLAQPLVAHADTVSPRDYRQRLIDARAQVVQARAVSGAARDSAVTRARSAILATTAVSLPTGELAINDSALADRIVSSDAALDAAVALLDAQIALVARVVSPSIDPAKSPRPTLKRVCPASRLTKTSGEKGRCPVRGVMSTRQSLGPDETKPLKRSRRTPVPESVRRRRRSPRPARW